MRYKGQMKPGERLPNGKKIKKPTATTREGALSIRNALYRPLKPCANGHNSLHKTKTNRCLMCEMLNLI